MQEGLIKLSKLAKDLGVTKQTLRNWEKREEISFIKKGGMNFVNKETYNNLLGIENKSKERIVIYCRVSSSENRLNLETQKERLLGYCNAKGYQVSQVVCEFGSGLNDKRPKLEKLLKEQNFTKLVVEHKDRLTRTGFNYLDVLLRFNQIEIEVVNPPENNKADLIEDFISIITSYCARIYGHRRSKRSTEKLLKELEKDDKKL